MSEEKELKKGNGEVPGETSIQDDEDIEGYAYCTTHKAKCMNDCLGGGSYISPLH